MPAGSPDLRKHNTRGAGSLSHRQTVLPGAKLWSMAITDDSKEKLKARLSRAIGHLNAVYRMVDEKKYCIDVLNQLKAVQAALDKTSEVILRQHLETCVVEAVQKQDADRVIEELMQVFRQAPSLYLADDEPAAAPGATVAKTGSSGCCH
jgi:DNA-binding FrmR family transcriptional regulator